MPTLRQATERPSNLAEMVQSLQPAHSLPFPSDPGSAIPDYSPLSLAPPPSILSTGSDQLKQFYRRGVSQYRIPPLPTKANASVNASIQSISKIVAQQVVASTPVASSSSGVTSVGLTMPGIFVAPVSGSPVTTAGTLATAFTSEPPLTVFCGPVDSQGTVALDQAAAATGAGPGVSVTGRSNGANEFALLAITAVPFGFSVVTQPDVADPSWNRINAIGGSGVGGGIFWKNVAASGNITGSATFSSGGTPANEIWAANLVTFQTSGTPAVRQTQSAAWSAATTTISTPSNTLAGSTIFLIAIGEAGTDPFSQFLPWAVSDSQGNTYTQVAAAFSPADVSGFHTRSQVAIFAAPKSTAAACTVTVQGSLGGVNLSSTIFWVLEVTGFAAPIQTPIFRLLVPSQIPNLDASKITTGLLPLARGGTNVDLSASGGTNQFLAMSAGHVISSVQPDFPNLSGVGKATKYNNISLVGNGFAPEYATVDNVTATANIAATTLYAVPASGAGLYRLSYYVIVNRAATTSSTLPDLQLTWTDPDNSTLQTFGPVDSSTPSANTLTTMYSGSVVISAKASTNIQYQTGVTTAYASVGGTSMQYSVHLKVEAL